MTKNTSHGDTMVSFVIRIVTVLILELVAHPHDPPLTLFLVGSVVSGSGGNNCSMERFFTGTKVGLMYGDFEHFTSESCATRTTMNPCSNLLVSYNNKITIIKTNFS
jgi:hypothetical protein